LSTEGGALLLRETDQKIGLLATKAMAAKLARLIYRMLRYGMPSSIRHNTANSRSSISSEKPPS
jgi:hypothetical protein